MTEKRIRRAKLTFTVATFIIAIGFAIEGQVQARHYERLLTNTYYHAFTELTTATGELDAALQKSAYTTPGPLRQSLCQQIYAKAQAAQQALGELPYGNQKLENTAAFLAKTGDYAAALSRGGIDGPEENLAALAVISGDLSAALDQLQLELEAGTLDLEEVAQVESALAQQEEMSGQELGGVTFQDVESDFPELPSLVYDGPFSQHLSAQEPKALAGLKDVTLPEARQAAARFLQTDPEALTEVSASQGVLPTYAFTLPQNGGTGYIEVTRQGGQVLAYFQDRTPGEPAITPEQATTLAENYLASWGFPLMEPSYHIQREGTLTIHFAPVVDGVYYYPDLVKLTLALDTGKLMGYEAHGYLSQHCLRDLPAPAVTQQDALTAVPGSLEVLSAQSALIPTAGGTQEVLTYEFKCQSADGRHVLVYVNAQTGLQQNILLLLEDETGTLSL